MCSERMSEETVGSSATLDLVVVALCADYLRREQAITARTVAPRTAMEYKYLNRIIADAARETVGEHYYRLYINDIGDRIGYAYSDAFSITERLYKEKKREVKLNIARRLHLLD